MAFRGTHHCHVESDDEGRPHAGISSYKNCKVNPGHEKFIPVPEITMDHLPPECRTEDWMKWIQEQIDFTVKVRVKYTSEKRPDTFPGCDVKYSFCDYKGMNMPRSGTGSIIPNVKKVEGPCPCPECKNEPKMEYWKFVVITASHVLFDKSEAESSEFEVFYDSEDRKGVEKLYGVDVSGDERRRYETDTCWVVCVTHDPGLADTLTELILNRARRPHQPRTDFRVMVSHPHGASKMVSVGRYHYTSHVSLKPGQSIEIEKGCGYRIPASNGQQKEKTRDSHRVVNDVTEPVNASHEHNKQFSQNSCHENLQPTDTAKVTESISLELFDSTLPFDMKVIPPPTASFLWRGELESGVFPEWVTFPTGTKFVTRDGTNVTVTPNTQFKWRDLARPFDSMVATYDMASCPGSSGAGVGWVGRGFLRWSHFGTSGEQDGCNVSGLWL